MKYLLCAMLAALLALTGLPGVPEGGAGVPVEAFIEKAGIEADAGLREKIEAFLTERHINARILGLMDPALVARYARHLEAGLPIDYAELLHGEAASMPGDVDLAALKRLAVLHPQGAAVESLLVDFERSLVYYDASAPVPEDVCRAGYAGALSEADAQAFRAILAARDLSGWDGAFEGDAALGLNVLVMDFGEGPVRCAVPGAGEAPEGFLDALMALLSRAAEMARDTMG